MRVIDTIGTNYSQFGTCLLNDEDGQKILAIEADNPKVQQKVKEIFTEWRKGIIS